MGRERVLRAIAQIERQKRAAGIVPPYATMRELHAMLSATDLLECGSMSEQRFVEYLYEKCSGDRKRVQRYLNEISHKEERQWGQTAR